MSPTVTEIWRHPIKAIGRERLDDVRLEAGAWLPYDRLWAVAHAQSRLAPGWMQKSNFLRGVTDPRLMAITCSLDETTGSITLNHPEAGQIEINPDTPADWSLFSNWIAPLWAGDLPAPTSIVRNPDVHMTDSPEPWISINSQTTLNDVSARAGQKLSPHRWRGNIWIDGLDPWEEFNWIGKHLTIGTATLRVEARITRCKATMANPETGMRDIDTLATLRSWGHQDFGVFAVVTTSGTVGVGQNVVVEEAL